MDNVGDSEKFCFIRAMKIIIMFSLDLGHGLTWEYNCTTVQLEARRKRVTCWEVGERTVWDLDLWRVSVIVWAN